MSTRTLPRSWTVGAAVAAAVATVGCGDEAPDVDDTGVIGPDELVDESIKVLQVQLEYPSDGSTRRGRKRSRTCGSPTTARGRAT